MHDFNFIEKIQNELYMRDGFSFNIEYGFHPPKKGYIVGGIDKELIFNSIESLTKEREKILSYLNKYGNQRWDFFLGGWIDQKDKKIHIEPSELFYSYSYALRIAKERNQKAIYNLETGEDIIIGGKDEN